MKITFFFFKDKEKDTLQNVLEGRDEYGGRGREPGKTNLDRQPLLSKDWRADHHTICKQH